MKPDGAGTDERISPEEQRRLKHEENRIDRDVMKLAIAFTVLAAIVCGTFFLRNRATMPDLSADNLALQQQ